MSTDSTPTTFTLAELWLLQACVRHEIVAQGTWHYPPASADLNDQIAEALLLCTDQRQSEASLILSWGDCLVIDATVPQDARDPNGLPLGKEILLKTYRARAHLRRDYDAPEVAPPYEPSKQAITQRLTSEWNRPKPEGDTQ